MKNINMPIVRVQTIAGLHYSHIPNLAEFEQAQSKQIVLTNSTELVYRVATQLMQLSACQSADQINEIICWAEKHSVNWIHFSADGTIVEDLPTYDNLSKYLTTSAESVRSK